MSKYLLVYIQDNKIQDCYIYDTLTSVRLNKKILLHKITKKFNTIVIDDKSNRKCDDIKNKDDGYYCIYTDDKNIDIYQKSTIINKSIGWLYNSEQSETEIKLIGCLSIKEINTYTISSHRLPYYDELIYKIEKKKLKID